jgi:hypothetical protein
MAFLALILDLAVVVLFAALGRDTHERGLDAVGVLATAWPFLAAAGAGWLVMRAWRRPWALWPTGVVVWLLTVVGGLALRGLTGGGLAFSFQVVTFAVLGVFILGHRLIALGVRKWARRPRMN